MQQLCTVIDTTIRCIQVATQRSEPLLVVVHIFSFVLHITFKNITKLAVPLLIIMQATVKVH